MEKFKEALSQLPTWTVLAWSNQLLSILYSNNDVLGDTVYPIVLRLAQEYPQAMWVSFNFVQQKSKYPKINHLLQPPGLVILFLEELAKVSLPSTRALGFLESIEDITNLSEMKQLWQKFSQTNFSTEQTRLDKIFFTDSIKNRLIEVVQKVQSSDDMAQDKESFQKNIGKLKNEIRDKKFSAVTKLSDLSRTLANFMKSSHKDTIEIPGQYEMAMDQVFKENTIKIAGFKDEVKVFSSLRKPIKITIIGDDGKDYDFLVKNGEDIRQDQRIGKY